MCNANHIFSNTNNDIFTSFIPNLRAVMNSWFDYVIEAIIYSLDIITIIIGCDDWHSVRNVCFSCVRTATLKIKLACISDDLSFIHKITIWWREHKLLSTYCIVGIYNNGAYRLYVVSIIPSKRDGCAGLLCFQKLGSRFCWFNPINIVIIKYYYTIHCI